MSTPTRIQRRRTPGWRMPDGAIYVGRGSMWGNPFKVVTHGGLRVVDMTCEETIADHLLTLPDAFAVAVAHYRCLMTIDPTLFAPEHAHFAILQQQIGRLRGHSLACWCDLSQPCHADVLLELANAPQREVAA